MEGTNTHGKRSANSTVHDYKKDSNLKTFCFNNALGKRKRSTTDEGDQSTSGQSSVCYGSTARQLIAHGYEIVPESFEDEKGDLWEPLIPVRPRNRFLSQGLALTLVDSSHPTFTPCIV
jgi:hypothetical protein